jgi:hypothetical protein
MPADIVHPFARLGLVLAGALSGGAGFLKRWFILALGLAVALGGLYLALSRKPAQPGMSEAVWPAMAADSVRSIEIRLPSDRYVLYRQGKSWFVRSGESENPAQAMADPAKIAALLELLALNKPQRVLPSEARQPDVNYGLDQPRFRIAVSAEPGKDKPAETAELALGRLSPSGDAVFAASSRNPGTVFLMAPGWARQIDHPADYYFDTRVFSVTEDGVTRLRSLGPSGPSWEIARKDTGFVFVLPESAKDKPVDGSEVKLLIHDLTGLKVRLLPEKVQAQGQPWLRFEVWGQASAPEVLEIFGEEPLPGMVLARSSRQPVFLALERASLDRVAKSGFDLEGRKVLNLDTGKVQSFRIVSGDQRVELEKTQDGWRDQAGGELLRGIDMALWRLTNVQFEAGATTALPGSAVPAMTCEILEKGGISLAVLRFFTDPDQQAGLCWLEADGSGAFYPVSDQLLKDLQGLFPLKK